MTLFFILSTYIKIIQSFYLGFLLRNKTFSPLGARRQALLLVYTSPTVLKSSSEGTLDAGTERMYFTTFESLGKWCLFLYHHRSSSCFVTLIVNICWYPRVASNLEVLLMTFSFWSLNIIDSFASCRELNTFGSLLMTSGRRVMFITWFVGGNRLHWLGIHLGRALYHYVPYKIRAYGIINSSQIIKSTYNSGIIENLCTTFFPGLIYHLPHEIFLWYTNHIPKR